MSRKYKIRDQQKLYFVTFSVIDWIDLFIRNEYRQILIESIIYCQKNKGLEVYAYCIMTSHVHMIVGSNGSYPLEGIIRDMKSFTSRALRNTLENPNRVHESRREWMLKRMYTAGIHNSSNNDFQLWQHHYHPVEMVTNEMIDDRLAYIHLNPVAAGFVDQPEAWLYSSARDYAGTAKGPVDLIFIQ
jgi:putative transposase